MRRQIGFLVLVVLFALPGVAADTSAWDVFLSLSPTRTLPGVPVQVGIRAVNASSTEQEAPQGVSLEVRSKGRAPFRPIISSDGKATFSQWMTNVAVAPGDASEVIWPVESDLFGAPFYFDGRMSLPGKCEVRAVVSLDGVDYGDEPTRLVYSKWMPLEVVEPAGEDRVVYEEMLRLGDGDWSSGDWNEKGFEFASFVWSSHRTSSYAAFVSYRVPRKGDETYLDLAREVHSSARDDMGRAFSARNLVSMLNREAFQASQLKGGDARAAALYSEAVGVANSALELPTANPWADSLRKDVDGIRDYAGKHPELKIRLSE